MQDAAVLVPFEIVERPVEKAAVVPHQEITFSPTVLVYKRRARDVSKQLSNKRFTRSERDPFDM